MGARREARISEHRIGGIAGNDRNTEPGLELSEARGIARDDGDLSLTRDERFNHAEAKPAATAGNENALPFECFHGCYRGAYFGSPASFRAGCPLPVVIRSRKLSLI
jgi:hypothetical protein